MFIFFIVIVFFREFVIQVVMNFGSSLQYGNQYIYQSMPRMLTLWLDYGAEMVEFERQKGKSELTMQAMRTTLSQLNQVTSAVALYITVKWGRRRNDLQ